MEMDKLEHDFLVWTSFPSSLVARSDTPARGNYLLKELTQVVPGANIKAEANFKWENSDKALHPLIAIYWYDAAGKEVGTSVLIHPLYQAFPETYLEWTKITNVVRPTIPANAVVGQVWYKAGAAIPGKVANCWLDDLKIYQDDVLIYSNDFSNWAPLLIIPAEIITGVAMIKYI